MWSKWKEDGGPKCNKRKIKSQNGIRPNWSLIFGGASRFGEGEKRREGEERKKGRRKEERKKNKKKKEKKIKGMDFCILVWML